MTHKGRCHNGRCRKDVPQGVVPQALWCHKGCGATRGAATRGVPQGVAVVRRVLTTATVILFRVFGASHGARTPGAAEPDCRGRAPARAPPPLSRYSEDAQHLPL
eukprot:gene12267-biopygen255